MAIITCLLVTVCMCLYLSYKLFTFDWVPKDVFKNGVEGLKWKALLFFLKLSIVRMMCWRKYEHWWYGAKLEWTPSPSLLIFNQSRLLLFLPCPFIFFSSYRCTLWNASFKQRPSCDKERERAVSYLTFTAVMYHHFLIIWPRHTCFTALSEHMDRQTIKMKEDTWFARWWQHGNFTLEI